MNVWRSVGRLTNVNERTGMAMAVRSSVVVALQSACSRAFAVHPPRSVVVPSELVEVCAGGAAVTNVSALSVVSEALSVSAPLGEK